MVMNIQRLCESIAVLTIGLSIQPMCFGQFRQLDQANQPTEHLFGHAMPSEVIYSNNVPINPRSVNEAPAETTGFSYRNGFLGKTTIGGSYVNLGIDDPDIAAVNDNLDGYNITFSCPISKLTSASSGVDFFAGYESLQMSGESGGLNLDMSFNFLTIGMRYYHEITGRFQPYASLGLRQNQFDMAITDSFGGTVLSDEFSDWVIYSAIGFEVDIFERLGLRLDIELLPEEFADGFLEGTLIYWSTQKRLFFQGGFQVPFESELSAGGILGIGVAF